MLQVDSLIDVMRETIDRHADELTSLDQAIGDGDHGINMKRGFDAVAEARGDIAPLPWDAALQKIGMTLVMKVGGASGPLYGTWFMAIEVPLFYTNPLGGDYQKYVGGTYHATEIFDFNGRMDELLDASLDTAYPVVSWVRISQWLPWMEMSGRHGNMYFNAMGKKLQSFDQLSDTMKAEIAANYPEYTAPPPPDDTRRNETSWTYMKKILDSRTDKGEEAAGH